MIKMIEQHIPIEGSIWLTLYETANQDKIIHQVRQGNLVTTVGKNYFAKKIGDDTGTTTTIAEIRFGSGDTPATLTDSGLGFELATAPIQFRSFENNTLQLFSSFGQGEGVGTFTEAGLFNNATPNQLLCRLVLTLPFTKETDQFLSIMWRLQIG